MEKVSVFIQIRVLFWPEISALGVLFNFDNECMRPPKFLSAPRVHRAIMLGCVYYILKGSGVICMEGYALTAEWSKALS